MLALLRKVSHWQLAATCFLILAVPTAVLCQQRVQLPNPTVAPRDTGATLAETKAWLEQELPRIATFHFQQYSAGEVIGTYDRSVRAAVLDGCDLHLDVRYVSDGRAPSTWTTRISLKDIDLGRLVLLEDKAVPGAEYVPAVFDIRIRAVSGIGDPFQEVSRGRTIAIDRTIIAVGDREQGERAVRALRRAAVLCGAKIPPF